MDGLHVVLITLIDDVFKSFKLILACLSGTCFKKSKKQNQNIQLEFQFLLQLKNHPAAGKVNGYMIGNPAFEKLIVVRSL